MNSGESRRAPPGPGSVGHELQPGQARSARAGRGGASATSWACGGAQRGGRPEPLQMVRGTSDAARGEGEAGETAKRLRVQPLLLSSSHSRALAQNRSHGRRLTSLFEAPQTSSGAPPCRPLIPTEGIKGGALNRWLIPHQSWG
jgi:hypothetical protein